MRNLGSGQSETATIKNCVAALDEYVEPETRDSNFPFLSSLGNGDEPQFYPKGILFMLIGLNLALVTIGILFLSGCCHGLRPRPERTCYISTSEIHTLRASSARRLGFRWRQRRFEMAMATIGAEWLPGRKSRDDCDPSSKELEAVMQALKQVILFY